MRKVLVGFALLVLVCAIGFAEDVNPGELKEWHRTVLCGDWFNPSTGTLTLTLMNWDDMSAKWVSSGQKVQLENVSVDEVVGQVHYDTVTFYGDEESPHAKIYGARNVDVRYWNARLARYAKERIAHGGIRAIPDFARPIAQKEVFFRQLVNDTSGDYVVMLSPSTGKDASVLDGAEVLRSGVEVQINPDLSADFTKVQFMDQKGEGSLGPRWNKAVVLMPFAFRETVTAWRQVMEGYEEARKLYLIDHKEK